MARNGITARRSFYRIWIAGKKSLVKRAQGQTTSYTAFNPFRVMIYYNPTRKS